jgi:hypothetical protein
MAILQNFRCARRWKNQSEEVREIERVVGNLERNGAGAFQNTFCVIVNRRKSSSSNRWWEKAAVKARRILKES